MNKLRAGDNSPGPIFRSINMDQNLRQVARLAYSFPVYERLIRYKLAALEKPDVISHLRDLRQAGVASILAVDLASQEVIIGCMAEDGPVAREVIGGRMVNVPR